MQNTIVIGRRLVPLEHIALIEPFDPAASTKIQTDRSFQARLVLIDRESVLSEDAVAGLALMHGFRMLADDGIATNTTVRFGVEAFEPMDGFTPSKPYRTRLTWRDLDGQTQSKLLVTSPEDVLAIVVRGNTNSSPSALPPAEAGRTRRMQASSFRPR